MGRLRGPVLESAWSARREHGLVHRAGDGPDGRPGCGKSIPESGVSKEEDLILIERAKKGDEGAYRTLLRKYERSVYTICLRMVRNREEAQDLAQDSFVKVFAMLERYNPTYAFSSWLFKITSNLCIDSLRKRRIEGVPMDEPVKSDSGDYTRQYESGEDDPETVTIKKERAGYLTRAIDNLPPHYKLMVLLRHQEGLSYEEIASTVGIPLGTVKARIHRARQMLRKLLEESGFS
jgi:RNA polymerase sigma factor (sigma-70 family)